MPKPKPKPKKPKTPKPEVVREVAPTCPDNPIHDGEDWDAVDEAVWESFPASDPPSHWAGADYPPEPADVRR